MFSVLNWYNYLNELKVCVSLCIHTNLYELFANKEHVDVDMSTVLFKILRRQNSYQNRHILQFDNSTECYENCFSLLVTGTHWNWCAKCFETRIVHAIYLGLHLSFTFLLVQNIVGFVTFIHSSCILQNSVIFLYP